MKQCFAYHRVQIPTIAECEKRYIEVFNEMISMYELRVKLCEVEGVEDSASKDAIIKVKKGLEKVGDSRFFCPFEDLTKENIAETVWWELNDWDGAVLFKNDKPIFVKGLWSTSNFFEFDDELGDFIITSERECSDFLHENSGKIQYIDKGKVDTFWAEYPNGVIELPKKIDWAVLFGNKKKL